MVGLEAFRCLVVLRHLPVGLFDALLQLICIPIVHDVVEEGVSRSVEGDA